MHFSVVNKRAKAETDKDVLSHKTTQMVYDVYNYKARDVHCSPPCVLNYTTHPSGPRVAKLYRT